MDADKKVEHSMDTKKYCDISFRFLSGASVRSTCELTRRQRRVGIGRVHVNATEGNREDTSFDCVHNDDAGT